MSELISNLKKQIVEQLNLVDIEPASIDENAPLFGDGLGLDSIDALELILLMQKKYEIKIATAEEGQKVFSSVKAMADFIEAHKAKA
ncbi:MAG TPA: phosphopantetheine-binding protein [Cytophagaceae bacterium]|jgi:acyl carrier protein|nr:phosphopantetheine-binding protein [Cytophagaceae bacterium]